MNHVVLIIMAAFFTSFLNKGMAQNALYSEVKLTALNSMERINQQHPSFGQAQAEIKAAKNEIESFQIVVHALQGNVKVIKAEMSDLTGEAGVISKDNITLYREEYVRVRRPSLYSEMPPGLYPDPLVPFINPYTGKVIEPLNQHRERPGGPEVTKGYEMSAIPFEVWQGQNQPLWVDISIPKNAAAGEYKGTFTITLHDQSTFSLPIKVTVWNFTLPDGPTLRNSFGNVSSVAPLFGVDQNSEKFQEIEIRYCRMMAQHRINPPLPQSMMPEVTNNGSLKISPERTGKLKKFIQDLHVTDFRIPKAPFKDVLTINREKAISYYKDYYRYVKENGWDKRAYLYMYDEPKSGEDYEKIKKYGALLHEAAPQLQCLVVEQTYQENTSWPHIDDAVDIWCPVFACIDRDSINVKLAQGDEVWSYTALAQKAKKFTYRPHYNEMKDYEPPYWSIDRPLTSYRVPTWINWQYKITGLLYWSTVYIKPAMGLTEPWMTPVYLEPGRQFNGEGYLMYPGIPCGINGPVPSIRLKNIRDAMDDYEYFTLLNKLAGREVVTRIVSTVAPEWWKWDKDPEAFLTARERIAKEILKFRK